MATDFFERQSAARTSTGWLVGMFVLAVVAIVGALVTIAVFAVQYQYPEPWPPLERHPEQITIPVIVGVLTLLVISGGTLFKVSTLRSGGGTHVAESLGGRRVYPNTQDPVERRLLNVVEEMAIASGTPVPPVFLLEEDGINAFAAGYSPSDAVLGITRGCATKLTRDELQGVIAHEFSHILNGDMRMSIRLIGILHGILLIGLTGHLVFRIFIFSGAGHSRRSSRSDGKGNGGQIILVLIAIAVTMIVVGFIGTFFGNLIKAAVSRQREYLADASAVQFTRNPSGIAGALKRIGAVVNGSQLKAANAREASHMYFSQGVWEGFSGLLATHPPLEKRIRAIDPKWDGEFPSASADAATLAQEGLAGFAGSSAATPENSPATVNAQPVDNAASGEPDGRRGADQLTWASIGAAVRQVGEPTESHRHYAHDLIEQLPKSIVDNAHDPYGARAIVFALLLDRRADIRKQQWQMLQKSTTPDVVQLTAKVLPEIDKLDTRARLPVVDMSIPALRSMSPSQYRQFHACFVRLAQADRQIDLFEWTLSQVLMRHLRSQFEAIGSVRTHYYGLQRLGKECSILLTMVAQAGNSDETALRAFERAAADLPEVKLQLFPRGQHSLGELQEALTKLTRVAERHRGKLVTACASAICADEHVTWQEAELLRGVADLLDCPMPPLLVAAPS